MKKSAKGGFMGSRCWQPLPLEGGGDGRGGAGREVAWRGVAGVPEAGAVLGTVAV